MRCAVIDIGSNSIKLVIAEIQGDVINILESLKNIVPIANDTFLKNSISQQVINQTVNILEKYKTVITDYDVSGVRIIATTAVREAENRDMLVDMIRRRTGFEIEVLTVGDIVYYINSYLSKKFSTAYPIHEKNLIIAELGSGSLDISVMQKGLIQMHLGLPLGLLRLKQLMNKFDESRRDVFEAITDHISNEFLYIERSVPFAGIDDTILIDENFTKYIPNILPRKKDASPFNILNIEDAQEILSALADKEPGQISRAYKIPQELAETIVAYAIILNVFFSLTRNKQVYVAEIALAEAMLANLLPETDLSKKYNKTNQLIAIAESICAKYNADLSHSRHVANLSETLFAGLWNRLGLTKETLLYLQLAAYLHDIGMFVHNRAHHKHSEYLISSMDLSRLQAHEVRMIACVSRYHRKAPPNKTHFLYNSLPPEEQIIVQKLSAILKMANSLDRSHKQKVKKLEVRINQKEDVTLIAQVSGNFLLEKADFADKKALFEEITGNKISLSVKS